MADTTPLSAQSVEFLSTLEGIDYPKALVERFPRIVNAMMDLRHDPVALKAYMTSLLRDMRGGRQGFPLDVLMNIQDMNDRLVGPETDPEGVVKWF